MAYTTWTDGDILTAAALNNNFHHSSDIMSRGLIEQEWQTQELYCQTSSTYTMQDAVIADIFTDSGGYANTVCAGTTSTYDASNDWYTNCLTSTDLFDGITAACWTELTNTISVASSTCTCVCLTSSMPFDGGANANENISRCYVVPISGTDPFYCMNVCLSSTVNTCKGGTAGTYGAHATNCVDINGQTVTVNAPNVAGWTNACCTQNANCLACYEWRYVCDCCYDFYVDGACQCQVTLTNLTVCQYSRAQRTRATDNCVSGSGFTTLSVYCSEAYGSSLINTVIRTFNSDRCVVTIHDDAVTPTGTCVWYDVVSDQGCVLACCVSANTPTTLCAACDCFGIRICQETSVSNATSCVSRYGFVTEAVS